MTTSFPGRQGRIGRPILFKECLRWGIVPFIVEDDLKMFYYLGLSEWDRSSLKGRGQS